MNKDIELFLYELNGRGFSFQDKSYTEFGFNDEVLNMVYEMWQASANRDGFVLVPVEPSEEMYDRAIDFVITNDWCYEGVYKAMIKASKENKDE